MARPVAGETNSGRSVFLVHGDLRRSTGARLGPALALAVVAAFATGCTSWREFVSNGYKVGPNYCQPAAPVADAWIEANDPTVSSNATDVAAWWQTFQDPVLNSLVDTAYRQNLTLRVAGMRIIEARAQRGIAVGELFPQFQQAFGTSTRTNFSNNAPNTPPNRFIEEWTTGASLAWELDFWGRFRRAVESADANLDASIENYDDVLVLLLAEVAQRYVDVRTAEARLEYARKNVESQRGTLSLAEVAFREGAKTRLDVTQAQTNLAETEATIPPLEASRRQAINGLCILLGTPPRDLDGELDARKGIPTAPPQVALGIPADLLRRRPDIRRAERAVAAQSALIGVAASELYPHFSIAGSLFLDAAHFRDLFDATSWAGNVGPSFQWNILNYGRLVNNIRVQDARFQQLAVQYQNLVLQANAEAENAVIGFLMAQQQVKALRRSTQAASEWLDLSRTRYQEGRTDFISVFIVQQALTQQQDLLAVAEGDVAKNLISLYKALGGGWQIRLADAESDTSAAPTGEPEPAPPGNESSPPQTPLPPAPK